MAWIKAYKGFDKDMKCRGFQFAYAVETPRRATVAEMTDEALREKARICKVPCGTCTWLHGCKYGPEIIRRGLEWNKKGVRK